MKRFNCIKFVTRKWIKVNDLLNGQYFTNKNKRLKTPMLRSDLSDYSDTYIVVKRTKYLLAAAANENNKAEKDVTFKNRGPFSSRISKIDKTLTEIADIDLCCMATYNLLEYSTFIL